MKILFHKIYTSDNLELHGLLYSPKQKTKTVIAHVHGMAGNFYENNFLDNLANTLTKNNIAFCPFNNRGNGYITTGVKKIKNKSSFINIGSAYEKFEDCIKDIKSHIDFLEKQGFKNIHLSGHSLGAPKVAYYLAKTQDKRIKSLILLSPSDMLGLVRRDKDRFKKDIVEAKKMIRNKKGDKLMSRWVWDDYPISANTYVNIFGDNSKAAIFNFLNPELGFKTLSKVIQPILSVMGKKDDVLVIPIEKIMNMISKETISSVKFEYKILSDANHSYKGFETRLANIILNWVKKN